jgi:hypothetical protein
MMAALVPGAAMAAGGKSIATAPSVAYGQQQLGNTADDQFLENSCGFGIAAWRSYWILNVLAGDALTIDWEAQPRTELKLMPVGTTDFTLFQTDSAYDQFLASNNRAQAQYTAPQTGAMPLYFRVCDLYGSKTGPYAFTATVRHALFAALTPISNIYKQSAIAGSATLADGTPAPDGLVFHLVAKWHSGRDVLRVATSTSSSGGSLVFQLGLPAETGGKVVRLTVTRGEDGAYQAARSAPVNVHVARGQRGKQCRKGFKKKKVHGKVKCVRVRGGKGRR